MELRISADPLENHRLQKLRVDAPMRLPRERWGLQPSYALRDGVSGSLSYSIALQLAQQNALSALP